MKPRRPEVADVFREHGPRFLARQGGSLCHQQRRVLQDITDCRTALLGGHKWRCSDCGHEEVSYNSCRNRHCPKCQASARAQWLEREATYLLDVEYFHLVFTLPRELGPLALRNKRQLYHALFQAAADTLLTIARDPKHLEARIGFLLVLHTWGQNLMHHPHLHCVVPGGGISPDRSRWVSCRQGFFLPVRVLSRLFRAKYLHRLDQLRASGKLFLEGSLSQLADPSAWKAFRRSLLRSEWVVYSKPPFGGPRQVLKYLARYTHRVAISNQRLLSLKNGQVRFRWKDYAHGSRKRVMSLDALEFIRRFLLHVLPKRFVRIRHYGILSNRSRSKDLEIAKRLTNATQDDTPSEAPPPEPGPAPLPSTDTRPCPHCKQGRLVLIGEVPPLATAPPQVPYCNTS